MRPLAPLSFLALLASGCILTKSRQDELEEQGAKSDSDGDGARQEDDCDDNDASLGAVALDADCDRALDNVDCDPNDPTVGDFNYDADCDGAVTAVDCNDDNRSVGDRGQDGDCDGTLTADDCDDADPVSTARGEDADCDGVLTSTDCNDSDPNAPSNDRDCDGVVTADDCDDNDETIAINVDEDGDGEGTCEGDCDDSDPNTYSGAAPEDSRSQCMRDSDGDGYGDSDVSSPIVAGSDCDDSDRQTYPGSAANERSTLCVQDDDRDGYGSESARSPFDRGSDCDDRDAAVYPGSTTNESDAICSPDNDVDGYGDESATAPFDAGTDCDDTDAAINPGAADHPFESRDCDSDITTPDLDAVDFIFVGEVSGDGAGTTFGTAGDLDNDGLEDFWIGAPYNSDHGYGVGKVYIVLGKSLITPGTYDLSNADYSIYYDVDNFNFGDNGPILPIGDFDGDGYDDFMIRLGQTWNYTYNGYFDNYYAYSGADFTGLSGGEYEYSELPSSVYVFSGSEVRGVGDINQDGYADVAEVVLSTDYYDTYANESSVYYGGESGTVVTTEWSGYCSYCGAYIEGVRPVGDLTGSGTLAFTVTGPSRGFATAYSAYSGYTYLIGDPSVDRALNAADYFGFGSVTWNADRTWGRHIYGQDFDGDGLADVIAGSYIYLGSSLSLSSGGYVSSGYADYSVSSGGEGEPALDMDGDGLTDWIGHDGRLILGTDIISGTSSYHDFDATTRPAGDLNGDGKADLLAGDASYGSAGTVWVILSEL